MAGLEKFHKARYILTKRNMHSHKGFYAALPKCKAEFVDGKMIDGKPVFGGGYETTKEWLGLLMMTLGVRETVKYLPEGKWLEVL